MVKKLLKKYYKGGATTTESLEKNKKFIKGKVAQLKNRFETNPPDNNVAKISELFQPKSFPKPSSPKPSPPDNYVAKISELFEPKSSPKPNPPKPSPPDNYVAKISELFQPKSSPKPSPPRLSPPKSSSPKSRSPPKAINIKDVTKNVKILNYIITNLLDNITKFPTKPQIQDYIGPNDKKIINDLNNEEGTTYVFEDEDLKNFDIYLDKLNIEQIKQIYDNYIFRNYGYYIEKKLEKFIKFFELGLTSSLNEREITLISNYYNFYKHNNPSITDKTDKLEEIIKSRLASFSK